MPIAAVPAYLGKDFKDASPGMRFGLLLPIWTSRQDQEAEVNKRAEAKSREGDEVKELLRRGMDAAIQQLRQRHTRPLPGLWDKNDFAARSAWNNIKTLTKSDQARMKALADRQSSLAQSASAEYFLRLDAYATAPFTTGLGNEHPLENGFAFLNPYGLPYLPGSGVKGVLRQAARELVSGDWGNAQGWDDNAITCLFGRESSNGDTDHLRGALSFWDVIPQIKGDSLVVEIMTPHQSHYYQQKRDRKTGDSTNPHDSGQPTPISFLTVPPGSGFTFHVVCNLAHMNRLAPALVQEARWKSLLTTAFEHAFEWLGFGAKTAVGYGAMESPEQRKVREERVAVRAEQKKEEARKQEEIRQRREAEPWQGAKIKFNRRNGSLSVEKGGKFASVGAPKSDELLNSLPPEIKQKVLANQFIRVTAYVSGNVLVRIEHIA